MNTSSIPIPWCGGYPKSIRSWAPRYGPSATRTTGIAGSKLNSFSVRVGIIQDCLLSPILFMNFMDRISICSHSVEVVHLVTSGLGLFSLQTMWPRWLYQSVTFNSHWKGLGQSVKRHRGESASSNLRPRFSAIRNVKCFLQVREDILLYV